MATTKTASSVLATLGPEDLERAGPRELSDALERGRIVHFPVCPIELPSEADLAFARDELHRLLTKKNVSYHPEVDRVLGMRADAETVARVRRMLVEHAGRVQAFLERVIPGLARDWTVGTCSFRPVEERGRNLSPHASNELVHVDAGAYGATGGDRILRFFVNVNPVEDRVWATKGTFTELYWRFGRSAGVVPRARGNQELRKRLPDHARSLLIRGLSSLGLSVVETLDSSPYDRVMRRFHNFMKDSPEFLNSAEGYEELRFAPFCAWMVLTDGVSHACVSGRFAFVNTFLLRLGSCGLPELAPINVLRTEG